MSFGIEALTDAVNNLCTCLSLSPASPEWETGWTPVVYFQNAGPVTVAYDFAAFSYQIEGFVWAKAQLRFLEPGPSGEDFLFVSTLPDFSDALALRQLGRASLKFFQGQWTYIGGEAVTVGGINSIMFVQSGGFIPTSVWGATPDAQTMLAGSSIDFDIVYPRVT